MKGWLLIIFCITSLNVFSVDVQILHTNDVHGLVEHSVFDQRVGGFERLKSLIEKEKKEALSKNISTLLFDSGDFLEGSIFYMADKGRGVFELMDSIGYNAITMGNHDWLMGVNSMNYMLKNSKFKFDYLVANFKSFEFYSEGLDKIKPYSIYNINGFKIGVIGLTTNEIFYKWRLKNSKITSPFKTAKKIAKYLSRNGVDYIIALTHLGHIADRKLISKSKYIDLVIGGHSHSLMSEPLWFRNSKDRLIPMVRAGSHGENLGKIILSFPDGSRPSLKSYETIQVKGELYHEETANLVSKVRDKINNMYGKNWLTYKLGTSKISLINSENTMTKWNQVIAESFKDAIDCDFAIHLPSFTGVDLPAGDITREMIIQSYPRFFNIHRKDGWYLYKIKIFGLFVKPFVHALIKYGAGTAFSGLEVSYDKEKNKLSDIFINGKKLKLFKSYSVVLPEGLVKGSFETIRFAHYVFKRAQRTKVSIWSSIFNYIEKIKVIE